MNNMIKKLSVRRRGRRGFSIAELLVVLLLIGIILAVGLPAFRSFFLLFKLRTSMRQMTSDIRKIRQSTITTVRPHRMRIDSAANTYRLMRLAPGLTRTNAVLQTAANWETMKMDGQFGSAAPDLDKELSPRVDITDSTFAKLIDADPDDVTDIVFNPDGTVNAVGGLGFSPEPYVHIDLPVSNQTAIDQYEITLNRFGKVTATGKRL